MAAQHTPSSQRRHFLFPTPPSHGDGFFLIFFFLNLVEFFFQKPEPGSENVNTDKH